MRRGRKMGVTDIDWVYISIVVGVHVAIWKEAIRKEGEKDKFWKGQKLIP
jgi:hypothetical protein